MSDCVSSVNAWKLCKYWNLFVPIIDITPMEARIGLCIDVCE